MREEYCTQPYPYICKEVVSGFKPMTNKSPRHNFTAAPGSPSADFKNIAYKFVNEWRAQEPRFHSIALQQYILLCAQVCILSTCFMS
ncbi:hypothetical protein AAZV13_19G008000 [Glycine max]